MRDSATAELRDGTEHALQGETDVEVFGNEV